MKRIYDVMQAMDTDPATFFKLVARGEISLYIESATGEQIKPPKEFWIEVIKNNHLSTRVNTRSFQESRFTPFDIPQKAFATLAACRALSSQKDQRTQYA